MSLSKQFHLFIWCFSFVFLLFLCVFAWFSFFIFCGGSVYDPGVLGSPSPLVVHCRLMPAYIPLSLGGYGDFCDWFIDFYSSAHFPLLVTSGEGNIALFSLVHWFFYSSPHFLSIGAIWRIWCSVLNVYPFFFVLNIALFFYVAKMQFFLSFFLLLFYFRGPYLLVCWFEYYTAQLVSRQRWEFSPGYVAWKLGGGFR